MAQAKSYGAQLEAADSLLEPKLEPLLTFPLERRSRWAEPGLKGETERRGGSLPVAHPVLGIWESPHLSLDLGSLLTLSPSPLWDGKPQPGRTVR